MAQRSVLRASKEEVRVEQGAVVAAHPLAAEAGLVLLARGGNAVDAAVAAAFAAGVVEPFMSGIGGGGYLLVAEPGAGVYAVEFPLRAGAAAHERLYELDPAGGTTGIFQWPTVRGEANRIGHRAMAVPGAVAGLCLAHERFGSLPLAEVLAPAVRLAAEGFDADGYVALNIAVHTQELRRYPATAASYLIDGAPPRCSLGFGQPVDRIVQPDLAETLRQIARGGPAAFYTGPFAEALARDSAAHDGLLTADDLAGYRATLSRLEPGSPSVGSYRGYQVYATPGPSGGATLLEILNLLEGFPLASLEPLGAEALHLVAEASRLAFVDRFAFLADPEYADVPLAEIGSKAYAAARRRDLDPQRANRQPPPGDPWAVAGHPRPGAGHPEPLPDAGCTTHVVAVDRERRMVTLTNTLLELFGSRVVVPGTGVLMNNGMFWFDPRPGRANSPGPSKRPLANMAPALVLREGRPFLAIGAPGGRKIISAVAQGIHRIVDYGFSPQEAAAAPRVHSEGPDLLADAHLPAATLAGLRARGQRVVPLENDFAVSHFARLMAVQVDPADGWLRAGAHVWQPVTALGY